jgi:hypothetical protein
VAICCSVAFSNTYPLKRPPLRTIDDLTPKRQLLSSINKQGSVQHDRLSNDENCVHRTPHSWSQQNQITLPRPHAALLSGSQGNLYVELRYNYVIQKLACRINLFK